MILPRAKSISYSEKLFVKELVFEDKCELSRKAEYWLGLFSPELTVATGDMPTVRLVQKQEL